MVLNLNPSKAGKGSFGPDHILVRPLKVKQVAQRLHYEEVHGDIDVFDCAVGIRIRDLATMKEWQPVDVAQGAHNEAGQLIGGNPKYVFRSGGLACADEWSALEIISFLDERGWVFPMDGVKPVLLKPNSKPYNVARRFSCSKAYFKVLMHVEQNDLLTRAGQIAHNGPQSYYDLLLSPKRLAQAPHPLPLPSQKHNSKYFARVGKRVGVGQFEEGDGGASTQMVCKKKSARRALDLAMARVRKRVRPKKTNDSSTQPKGSARKRDGLKKKR